MVERPGLYVLAGGGEVEMKEWQTKGADTDLHRFAQKKGFSTKIRLWIRENVTHCKHET